MLNGLEKMMIRKNCNAIISRSCQLLNAPTINFHAAVIDLSERHLLLLFIEPQVVTILH